MDDTLRRRWIGLATSLLVLASSTVAAQKVPEQSAATRSEMQSLAAEFAQSKEIATLKLDAQEKRIADLGLATAQQANHLSAIANETASVANYIAVTSIFITLIVFVAGIGTYFTTAARATKEANVAAARWFEQNAGDHGRKLDALRREVEDALGEIGRLRASVKSTVDETNREMADYSRQILSASGSSPTASKANATSAVQEASEELKAKPEADFTAGDYLTRGLAEFSEKRFETALDTFRKGLNRIGHATEGSELFVRLRFAIGVTLGRLERTLDALDVFASLGQAFDRSSSIVIQEQTATAMVNRGMLLGKLDRHDEAIAAFDEVRQRLAPPASETIRSLMILASNGASFGRIMKAKAVWPVEAERRVLLDRAIADLEGIGADTGMLERSTVLGNLGYALFLRGGHANAAVDATRECLTLNDRALEVQRKDSNRHRIEPVDTDYQALLDRLWAELHAAS